MREEEQVWLERLEIDGLVSRTLVGARPTKRWHAALARAALELYREDETLTDLRTPIARALVELYSERSAEEIVIAIGVLLPIVTAALDSSRRAPSIVEP